MKQQHLSISINPGFLAQLLFTASVSRSSAEYRLLTYSCHAAFNNNNNMFSFQQYDSTYGWSFTSSSRDECDGHVGSKRKDSSYSTSAGGDDRAILCRSCKAVRDSIVFSFLHWIEY